MKYFEPYYKLGAVLLLTVPVIASAATISSLTEAEFYSLVPTNELNIETFEIYPEGLYPASQEFSDFTYGVTSGAVYINKGFEAGVGFNKTLSGSEISDRLFEFYPLDNVLAFGTDMKMSAFGSGPQTFEVTVTGNSGVSTFFFDRTSSNWSDWHFEGFYDSLGLISINFSNLGYDDGTGIGRSNYAFDNVRTLTAVPVPSALILFVSGTFTLMAFRKRRKFAKVSF